MTLGDPANMVSYFRLTIGRGVEDSRDEVATYYGIRVSEVLSIEREGIDKAWPPLEDGP